MVGRLNEYMGDVPEIDFLNINEIFFLALILGKRLGQRHQT